MLRSQSAAAGKRTLRSITGRRLHSVRPVLDLNRKRIHVGCVARSNRLDAGTEKSTDRNAPQGRHPENGTSTASPVLETETETEVPRASLSLEDVYPSKEMVVFMARQDPENVPEMTIDEQHAAIRAFLQADNSDQTSRQILQACKNDASNIHRLGNMVLQSAKGIHVAKELYHMAMKFGSHAAGVSYAVLQYRGYRNLHPNKETKAEGFRILFDLARLGNPNAQMELSDVFWEQAHIRARGQWVEEDGTVKPIEEQRKIAKSNIEAALDLLDHAGRGGISQAFTKLGQCYRTGNGVTQDHEKAVKCFLQAVEKNPEPAASFYLSYHYAQGLGIEKDDELSFTYLQEAASAGLAEAQYNLSIRYSEGIGCEQQRDLALEYLKMASMQNYAPAMFNLATQYRLGVHVPVDKTKAREIYERLKMIPNVGSIGNAARTELAAMDAENLNDTKVEGGVAEKRDSKFCTVM